MGEFNRSFWHAAFVLGPVAIIVFGFFFWQVRSFDFYYFEPRHQTSPVLREEKVEYGPQLARYTDLAKFSITLSAGAIAFLINSMVGQRTPLSPMASRILNCAPIVVGFFGAAIGCLVLFMLAQNVWYEEYLHSPDHSTYRPWKYAVSNSLGYTGLLSFLLGFVWLAANVF